MFASPLAEMCGVSRICGRLFLVVYSFVTDRVIRRRPIRVIGAGSRHIPGCSSGRPCT